ncbi:hypothetical protein GCM10010269_78200 [Streptomyces humidus]|uniref:Ig-like domain repeat protein n=1 Tax=Streptomyces humidus TaxID=52259 RepID=A0A918GBN0_9ACTN|nr:hypothetical protein [Streptomyces humidus]GGS27924.1 hypothetical protein GCM10010269_78200 [Streptomyces humidus]
MRTRRIVGGTALITVAASLTVVTGTGTALADGGIVLPIASHWQTITDGRHERVYVSAPGSDAVVAVDFDGQVVKTIEQLDGARAIALSPDESTLYVALPDADAVAAVDTATLQETRRFATGAGTDPESLAVAGGRLWFSHGDNADGGIGSITVADPEPVVDPGALPEWTWYGKPMLASSTAAPGLLVAGETAASPGEMRVYDVSSGQTREVAHNPGPGGDIEDMAITPDGQSVITATGSPYYHQKFRLSDLTETGRYDTGPYPNAVAVAPNGAVAAGCVAGGDHDVYLYRPGSTTPVRTVTLNSPYRDLLSRGLAWSPDGTRLFALRFTYGSEVIFEIIRDADKAAGELTLDVPATGTAGKRLTVRGTLTSVLPYPEGTTVAVSRDGARPVTRTVAADGTFRFTDRPRTAGTITYTVTHHGDADHSPTTATATLDITG